MLKNLKTTLDQTTREQFLKLKKDIQFFTEYETKKGDKICQSSDFIYRESGKIIKEDWKQNFGDVDVLKKIFMGF